jgi:hypothetical protein
VITGLTLEVETTMEKTPDHPDQRDQKDAENGFGQGGQGSSALLFQLGDDGYLDVLERAYATGHITEQERREARLVHLAVFRARAA